MVKGRQDNKHQEGVTLIMGITEARWTGAGKQRLNSGETIIWLRGDRIINTRRVSHSSWESQKPDGQEQGNKD